MEHCVVCKKHNNRKESYIVLELVSHIAISFYCFVIFFDFTIFMSFSPKLLSIFCLLLIANLFKALFEIQSVFLFFSFLLYFLSISYLDTY
jgi:hypothetical protein